MKIININQHIRKINTKFINKFNDSEISLLKEQIFSLYKLLIQTNKNLAHMMLKTMFIDHLSVLNYKIQNDFYDDEDLRIKEIYDAIDSVDALIHEITKDEELFVSMFLASIKFDSFNDYGKFKHLNTLTKKDFSLCPYHFLEFINLNTRIDNINLELINDDLKSKLLIISEIDYASFIANINELLYRFYSHSKSVDEFTNKNELDEFIIDLIENNDLEYIIYFFQHDDDILSYLISICKLFADRTIYDDLIPEKVKTKLKRLS